jgi:hypothetical protein
VIVTDGVNVSVGVIVGVLLAVSVAVGVFVSVGIGVSEGVWVGVTLGSTAAVGTSKTGVGCWVQAVTTSSKTNSSVLIFIALSPPFIAPLIWSL